MALDAESIQQYSRDGFILLRGLFEAEEVERFEARFVELALEGAARPDRTVVMRDIMVVRGAVEPASRMHAVNKLMSFEDDPELFR